MRPFFTSILLILSLFSMPAFATSELAIPANSLVVTAHSAAAGDIRVVATLSNSKVMLVSIQAFGKRFMLDKDQLAAFKKMTVNGLHLSESTESGVWVLYVTFSAGSSMGFVSQYKSVVVGTDGVVEIRG